VAALLLAAAVVIVGILLGRQLASSRIPGIDSALRVQEGSIRVKSAERTDSLTMYGQNVRAKSGHEVVMVDVQVKGTVPLACVGDDDPCPPLSFGHWELVDARGKHYPVGGLLEGKLVFQVNKPASGLVLWLSDEVSVPLGSFFGEQVVQAGVSATSGGQAPLAQVSTPTPTPAVTRTPKPTSTSTPMPMITLLHWLRGLDERVKPVLSPDGELLASVGASSYAVKVWRTSDGSLLHSLEGHTARVWHVTFSPTGKYLASGGPDGTARLWEVSTGSLLHVFEDRSGFSNTVFSPDEDIVATSSRDAQIRLWRVSDGTPILSLEGGETALAFAPDGELIAGDYNDQDIRLWSTTDGTVVHTLKGHTARISELLFSPTGKVLISRTYFDHTVRVWQVSDGSLPYIFHKGNLGDEPWSMALSPDGGLLALASSRGDIWLCDLGDGSLLHTLDRGGGMRPSLAFSPAGGILATTGAEIRPLTLWRLGEQVQSFRPGVRSGAKYLTFSADGRMLATSHYDSSVRLWSVNTERESE
jgi:hypothetical protein